MPKVRDMSGRRYGRLVCLSWEKFGGTRGDMSYWKCKCDCGNTAVVSIHFLKNSPTPSCGCWLDENRSKFNLQHGMSNSPEYSVYKKVKQRCENPNNEEYENYGGRGIRCLFASFDEFYEALGERPNNASIERHNVNDDYRPGNCYWETNWSVQSFNRRSNKVRKNKLPLGVFFMKSSNTYYAAVSKDGKRYARWGFRSVADALEATKELELELFGFNRDRSNEEGVVYEEI